MKLAAAAGLAAAVGCAAPALADEAVELPLVEITAPATALPPGLPELPASATRVARDALAQAQYQVNLSEALARVPGLVVNNRHNYAQDLQLSLRGFGARAPFGVRGIRLYSDGIPATMPDGQGQIGHFDLPSAESVTVLRGPFSALYGSSSGGVLEIVTRDPAASFADLSAWSAADALQRYALSGALARESWSALGSGSWFDTAGAREHSAATRGGGQLRLGLGDGVVALVNTLDQRAQDPLGLTRAEWEQDPRQATPAALEYDTRKTVRQTQAGAALTHDLGGAHATRAVAWVGRRDTVQFQSIPDFVQGTLATNPTHPGGVIDLDRAYYGADVRWLWSGEPVGLALGVDAEFLDERRQGFQNFIGTPGPASDKGVRGPQRRDEDNGAASVDPYAQAHWRVADDWQALLGLRYATVRFTSDDRFVAPGNGDDGGATHFAAWLPVAGLRYAPGPLAFHVAAARGSETPTLNELAYRPDGSAGLNTELGMSRSTSLELGAHWSAEPLRVEAAVFRIDTRDEIVVAGSSGGRTTFRNAAGTQRNGFELGLRWQPVSPLTATAAYAFVDARYEDGFCPGACPPAAAVPAGNRLPGVPRHALFGEVASQWRGLTAALETLYRGDVPVNDAGTDAAPGHAVVNFRAAYALPAGFELMGRADNLLDRRYAGSVIVNETNGRYFEPAPGRGFGIGVRWSGSRP